MPSWFSRKFGSTEDKRSTYQFKPLDPRKKEIRVLAMLDYDETVLFFRPGPRPSNICALRGELRTISLLDKNEHFTAISYAWSEGNPRVKVAMDDFISFHGMHTMSSSKRKKAMAERATRSLEIPQDVYGILGSIKGWLWVDQICINQKDLKEKSWQLALMDQIYSRAGETIIWLGEASADSSLALEFVDEIKHDVNVFTRVLPEDQTPKRPRKATFQQQLPVPVCKTYTDPLDPAVWKALRALFERKWWHRTWTIQEGLISSKQNTKVRCGWKSTHIYQFTYLYRHFEAKHKKHHLLPAYVRNVFRGIPFVEFISRYNGITMGLWNLANGSSEKKQLSLIPMMFYASNAGCSEYQDRIFALLSFCNQNYCKNIQIDCAAPIENILLNTFRFLATADGLRAIQLGKLVKGSNFSLPSWVPDLGTQFSLGQWFHIFDEIWSPLDTEILVGPQPWSADGKAAKWNALGMPKWTMPLQQGVPATSAVRFSAEGETLACRGIVFDVVEVVEPASLFSPQEIAAAVKSMKDLDPASGGTERLCELERIAMSYSSTTPNNDPYSSHKNQAFWQTMLTNRDNDHQRLRSYPKDTEAETPARERAVVLGPWFQRTSILLRERTFVVTKRGYFGLAPPLTQKGDLVCVLHSAHVPFVLRRIETITSASESCYSFVGDAYVQGISEGEIFQWAAKANADKDNRRVLVEEFWIR